MRTRPVLISFFVFIVILFVMWATGWISMPFQTTSVENTKEQWAFAYQYNESLKSTAQQVINIQNLVDSSTGDTKTQRENQLLAYQNNYSKIKAEYDAKLKNAFEAKWVKPSDVPGIAPTLEEMIQKIKQ